MQIEFNMITGNVKGLYAVNSDKINVFYNNCTDSNQFAFDFYRCIWIDIKSNMIYSNKQTGVKFNEVQFSIIWNNFFIENYGYAVYLKSSADSNEVYLNNFIDNALSYESQAYDSGENLWYDDLFRIGNFWSDLGFNCYYLLDGATGALDLYPVNKEVDCTIFTPPTSTTEPTTVLFPFDLVVLTMISTVAIVYLKQKKRS
jgi:nitrous oxidase accessory protein NosD